MAFVHHCCLRCVSPNIINHVGLKLTRHRNLAASELCQIILILLQCSVGVCCFSPAVRVLRSTSYLRYRSGYLLCLRRLEEKG